MDHPIIFWFDGRNLTDPERLSETEDEEARGLRFSGNVADNHRGMTAKNRSVLTISLEEMSKE
jgi:hypothetical protein